MRFNTYLNTHFKGGGCRLLGAKQDPHRGRHVQVYAMPGYTDVIGLTDGTDSWVAPAIVVTAHFGTELAEQVRRLQAGQALAAPVEIVKRSRVPLDDEELPVRPVKSRSSRVSLEV